MDLHGCCPPNRLLTLFSGFFIKSFFFFPLDKCTHCTKILFFFFNCLATKTSLIPSSDPHYTQKHTICIVLNDPVKPCGNFYSLILSKDLFLSFLALVKGKPLGTRGLGVEVEKFNLTPACGKPTFSMLWVQLKAHESTEPRGQWICPVLAADEQSGITGWNWECAGFPPALRDPCRICVLSSPSSGELHH